MYSNDVILFGSYNCRGINDTKKVFLKSLLSKIDILLLQEHWLSDCQLSILGSIDQNFLYTGSSGFTNDNILTGRPYGGTAILWRSSLKLKVVVLEVKSRRLSAIKLSHDCSGMKLLLINVYMPFENDERNVDCFSDQLLEIEMIIYNNLDHLVILGGDFNVDFSRSTMHTTLLRSFCDSLSLNAATFHDHSLIDYTYQFTMTRFSTIDHFIVSPELFHKSLLSMSVMHDVSNLSDHDPIILTVKCTIDNVHHSSPGITNPVNSPHISWVKANDCHIMHYRVSLTRKLASLPTPHEALLCHDINCRNVEHKRMLVNYAADITDACIGAGVESIPRARLADRSKQIPGWNDIVKPYHEKSLFWHNLWVECGRPKTGAIADTMRRTRASYHHSIRQARRRKDEITKEHFAKSLIENKGRDFWKEVKKIRNSKVSGNYAIDGLNNVSDIARVFGDSYRDLYSSVAYDDIEMCNIRDNVNQRLQSSGLTSDCFISPIEVSSAASMLKRGKSDVNSLFSSDHIIFATNELFVHISCLFSGLVIHNVVPNAFLCSSIRPIPKGHNQNLADSANYRGIAIGSVFCKLFDHIVLSRYRHLLSSNNLQFGFKKGHCTQMCTMVLKEAISYYVNNNNAVFCTFLDATKAFDRVQYCKLFNLLIDRKLPSCIIRFLISFYIDSVVFVSWSYVNSESFTAFNGVKQGGILSPILFCIYIDQILYRLSGAGVGCYLGDSYVGCLAYADDLVLIAPTPSAMRKMLRVCDDFANEYYIRFNASKSKCVMINAKGSLNCHVHAYKCNDIVFKINKCCIEFVSSYKHLGHVINNRFNDDDDLYDKRASFIGQANNVICYFNKLSADVKQRLFNSYCTSFFGCELWRLDHPVIGCISVAWRRAIRRIWSLPHTAHCNLLPLICDSLNVHDEFYKRFVKFVRRCLNHDSPLIRNVVSHGIFFSRASSQVGYNAALCVYRFPLSVYDLFIRGNMSFLQYFTYSCDSRDIERTSLLKDLIDVRDGLSTLSTTSVTNTTYSTFTRSELDCMIAYVSTM